VTLHSLSKKATATSVTAHDHLHIKDLEAHLTAIEADLEYFRRKRLDARVLHFARRGIVPLAALIRTATGMALPSPSLAEEDLQDAHDLEEAVKALQERLDALVLGIATFQVPVPGHRVVIDDLRHERGDYHDFLRLNKMTFGGTPAQRISRLDAALADCELLLDVFTGALVRFGGVSEEQLRERRKAAGELGYRNGARIVARAWVDPEFKSRLLSQGRAAVRELGIPPGKLGVLGVAENTESVHNVVVCTLCSCYPHDVLGDAPWWYRTEGFRQNIVLEPRETLQRMFGLELSSDITVRVHDSTSDVRWMVLPARPAGTEGMSEEELAELVTADSLVGAGLCLPAPDRAPSS
jgi:nitrile hydratase